MIMLLDYDSIIEEYFNKKENDVYIDEDELFTIISCYFDCSRIPILAIKNSLRSYMKKVRISGITLKLYLEKAFAFA